MSDPRDYKLDLQSSACDESTGTGRSRRPAVRGNTNASPGTQRPYLSVHFACCGVYQRVYRSPDGNTYAGRCPKCTVPVRFVVGPGGTSARCFVVR